MLIVSLYAALHDCPRSRQVIDDVICDLIVRRVSQLCPASSRIQNYSANSKEILHPNRPRMAFTGVADHQSDSSGGLAIRGGGLLMKNLHGKPGAVNIGH